MSAPRKSKPNLADNFGPPAPRTPGDYGRGHLKVDNLLSDADRPEYHALLRRRGTTVNAALRWLRDRGYQVGRGAVLHHKRKFDRMLESVRQSAEMSLVCAELVRQVGEAKMGDVAVLRFETLLNQALFALNDGQALDADDWQTMGRALNHAIANRTKIESIRLAAEQSRRRDPPADKSGDRPAARKPLDGAALSDKVRRILGVPLPGEPTPGLPPPRPPAPATLSPVPRGEGGGEGPVAG